MTGNAEGRAARVVTHVLRATLALAGARGLILEADETPEGLLLARWCAADGIAVLETGAGDPVLRAHPASRTTLLLDAVPAAPLLPLGDVPASVISSWTGDWTGTTGLRALAAQAGGIDALDAGLARWLDERYEYDVALAGLPADVVQAVRQRFEAGRFGRHRAGLVPKLGHRTIGHDLRI